MAIALSENTFTLMPEGFYVFKIDSVEYKPDFGKIKITMVNSNKQKHFENFSLIGKDGGANEKAIMAFSSFARSAMHNPSLTDVEPADLVGKFIKGEISHREYTKKDGTMGKATQKKQGTYWEECTAEEEANFEKGTPAPQPAQKTTDLDLASILG